MEVVSEFGNAEMNIYAIAPTTRRQEPAHSLMQLAGTTCITIKMNIPRALGVRGILCSTSFKFVNGPYRAMLSKVIVLYH